MEKTLDDLRAVYHAHPDLSLEQIADRADLSRSTVQRYLSGPIKNPDYFKILAIRRALVPDEEDKPTAAMVDPEVVGRIDDADQLRSLVLHLRQINIDELATTNAEWRARLDAADKAHAQELARMAETHNAQILHLQDSKRAQIDQLQRSHDEQIEMFRQLTTVQKQGDERSKSYLRRQILLWRVIAFILFAVLLVFFILDVRNPGLGWLRRIGTMFSVHSSAG